ncbi:uncharacterized protein LOC113209250 [Frankliniella occidentalis]|uniref:Uncharacterized protein LOC113209250 n=1 Tax=Frankliniella occidentalis TaxID=133901 RepID=A0A6J1SMD8_FRAOC|nr:uncharacterized protein LOC113209250 [Frankliniella occidentalis]
MADQRRRLCLEAIQRRSSSAPPSVDSTPDDTPSADDDTPSADATTPSADATTPSADATTPSADATTPSADATTPSADATTRSVNSTPLFADCHPSNMAACGDVRGSLVPASTPLAVATMNEYFPPSMYGQRRQGIYKL